MALNLAAAYFTALISLLSLYYVLIMLIPQGTSLVSWLVYGRTSWKNSATVLRVMSILLIIHNVLCDVADTQSTASTAEGTGP